MASLVALAGLLRPSDVVAGQTGELEPGGRKGQVIVRQGKGLRERAAPLSRKTREEIKAYLALRPPFAGQRAFAGQAGRWPP